MRLKYYSIIGFLILYFLCTSVSAQNVEVFDDFKELSLTEKLKVFKSLSETDINNNSHLLLSELSEYSNEKLDKNTLFNLKLALANLNYFKGDYINSITILKDMESKKELSISDKVEILSWLKKSYYKLHLYPEIFDVNFKIKELINKGANYPLWNYNMNSKLYAQLKQYDKAATTLRKELEELISEEKNDPLIISSGFNDLGYYYFRANNLSKALLNYNKALTFAERTLKSSKKELYRNITAIVKGNIGEVFIHRNEYKKAIPLLQEDIEVGMITKENMGSTAYSCNLLVLCYIKNKNYDKALKLLKELQLILKKQIDTDKSLEITYLKNKATLFYALKENDSSYYYFNKVLNLKDSVDNRGLNRILASSELIYNRSEERKLKEQHKLELKNQEIEIKDHQRNIVILLAGLLLMFLTYSLYNSYYLKKSKKEIKQKNKQIKVALSEKEVLLKEVHHRVKNNLQIISGLLELQQLDIDNNEVKVLLQEGQNRIQSVALVHKMMYQSEDVSKVNMQSYLEELIYVLKDSYAKPSSNIVTKIVANEIDFDINIAVPISLIVNEAVCNSYKHAFNNKSSGTIEVSIYKNKNSGYNLSIQDDGSGLSDDFDFNKINSMGFDLIKGLTRQLRGTLEINNSMGTVINVVFNVV